ncbi:hypothetical protein ACROYT_G035686 [Oculina patagonica]
MVDDVPVAHSLVAVATAYDFLYEHLNDTLRSKILQKVSDVSKELYGRSFKLSWGTQYIQNHVATNYVALFTGALVVEKHNKESTVWKGRAHHMLNRTMFLLSHVIDGCMEEGAAYGSYTSRSLTQYIFLAKRHLGIDLTRNIWLEEHFWFIYHTILPGFTETVGIADSNSNWFYGPESQLVFLDNYVLRKGYGNWLASKIRKMRLQDRTLRGTFGHSYCTLHTEFLFYNASIPEKEPPIARTPQFHVFEDWGVVTYGGGALDNEGQRSTFLSFKSSVLHGRAVNEIVRRKPYDWITGWRSFHPGHEHPDQGSFVFAPNGVPFITEALYGPKYTWLNNVLLFGPTTKPTCSGPFEGQIGDCGKWMNYRGETFWFADAEIVAATQTEEVVFMSGEMSGWYSSSLGLASVYRALVLLRPGVLLVVDHIEKRVESPTRDVGAFFHNRNTSFEVQKDKDGATFGSITLQNETYLVHWTNSHEGHSIVRSQSIEYRAEAGRRKTHFLNITTKLKNRQTRLAYVFVAPGNKVTKPKLQGKESGVHASLEINGLPCRVSIATKYNSSKGRRSFLSFDGFARVQVADMDIKTLLHNLREEVSCSVCTSIFTEPKQLPCLHSFCLHCLRKWHRASFNGRGTIKCPNCQALSRVPESGDLKDLPTSFYLNGMIDVLTIKECNSGQVKCGNCDKKSSECNYCFQCSSFWCEGCVSGHNIIRSYKDHRVLALKEFQDKDYEDVLKRPVFCTKQRHQNEELRYFCKNCQAAVCQTCVTLEHAGHGLEHIEEEAERQKTQMRSLIETQRHNLQAKVNAVSQLEEDCAKLTQQSESVKKDVQTFADKIIAATEAKKQSIFEAVENQTKKSLEGLTTQKTEMEHEINAIGSSLEQAEKLLTRSTNAEIVQMKETLETIVGGVSGVAETVAKRESEGLPVLAFVENQKVFDFVNTQEIGSFQILRQTKANQSVAEGQGLRDAIVGREAMFVLITKDAEGRQCYNKSDLVTVEISDERGREYVTEVLIKESQDGIYKISYFPSHQGTCKVSVKINEENVRDSPFPVQVKPMQFTPLLSFGRKGSSIRMLNSPCGLAVNDSNDIAVTELSNHRVQIFSSEGNYLRSFGRQGSNEGQFNKPIGIAFAKNGNIFVADSENHRIQIFSGLGEYLGTFGSQGSLNNQLCNPHGLSINSSGNIIVADSGNKLIKIFSPNGEFLMQIGEQGFFTCPTHCVQYDEKIIVSDGHEHCVKVFDRKGDFKFTFGKQGGGDGEFNNPRCLSVNKSGHLMVCDSWNNRIQVFEMNGKFICKFGTKGENVGEFKLPSAVAFFTNGQLVVSERYNDRVQIFH